MQTNINLGYDQWNNVILWDLYLTHQEQEWYVIQWLNGNMWHMPSGGHPWINDELSQWDDIPNTENRRYNRVVHDFYDAEQTDYFIRTTLDVTYLYPNDLYTWEYAPGNFYTEKTEVIEAATGLPITYPFTPVADE